MATTNSLKNINFMSQSKYDSINPRDDELYAVETSKFVQSIYDGVMPDYDTAVTIPTSSTPAPYNCLVICGITSANQNGYLYVNGYRYQLGNSRDDSHDAWLTLFVPKGVPFYIGGGMQHKIYYKLKGES